MINVRNIQSEEIIKVASLRVLNGKIAAYYDFPEPSQKWLAKFPFCVKTDETVTDEKHGVECRVFTLADGYELTRVKSERRPRHFEALDAAPEAETTAEPEAPVMDVTIQPEAIEEVPETTAEPEARKATKERPVQPKAKRAEAPSLDAATQAFAALTPLFVGVEANVTANVMEKLQPLTDKVEAICSRAPQTIVHVIKTDKGSYEAAPGEVFHANFEDICSRINRGSWVYLYGPTGSGKNVMAEQVAKALGLDFHYQAHTLDRFELTGFIDASGCYQPTEFFKAYTEGGLFMLDELDASDENALVTLNSACNGYFAFPCGTVKAHPNFRCIAAGNTCGRGGTDDYTARRTMDVSSLGRFIPRYHGYCDEIDMAAAGNNAELVAFIHALRKIKHSVGCQIIASPRQIKEIVKDEAQGLNLTQTLADMFGTYLTADELNIVKESLRSDESLEGNKYVKAFKRVQAIEY